MRTVQFKYDTVSIFSQLNSGITKFNEIAIINNSVRLIIQNMVSTKCVGTFK